MRASRKLPDGRNAVVDRSLLTGNASGVFLRAQLTGSPQRPAYGADHTIQENLIQDASLWSDDPAASPTIPWMFVKANIRKEGQMIGEVEQLLRELVPAWEQAVQAGRKVTPLASAPSYGNGATQLRYASA